MKRVAVLKLGGELIESDQRLAAIGKAIKSAATKARLVIVHGGGREIDVRSRRSASRSDRWTACASPTPKR